ncbi:hypothetical protein [Haliscomenobacter hydrossis]|uniref:Glycosyltransferase RgtA/B/C/D-like domain-containing protein n=1 Tax=Haliscomenobacter hydrossis (strain ATCC 27775 / DSM 1100 / LMG 10767 / O) TaxID=760192 RepID=F4KPX2_HALH1|nr:hypothetical protein [Haliscomenobacter hydrossis]AEE53176.1 hypothetical protein Halhy_5351 [Haliscomenobacter hydrossis DSM 1100]
MHLPKSLLSLLICWALLFSALFFYFPKWKNSYTEATISWDVSGYYYYLPAAFIYKDLKHLSFKDQIQQQYHPSGDFQQAFVHTNGNYVFKYSCGQALLYTPFFFIAHAYASMSDQFPADGFSLPYQFMIGFGSLLVAFLGLFVLRWVLLKFFSDQTTALTLILLVFGTNYLEYASITGAMSHNYLFTLYCILLSLTIGFYEKPSALKAVGIGLVIGFAALVRPTEIICALIPVLWGLQTPLKASLAEKLAFFKKNALLLSLAVLTCGLVGSLQLIYWKAVAGDWIVYSYQDQGFSWLRPHLFNGLLSYRSGWLLYTPMMIFALIGFKHLSKHWNSLYLSLLIYTALFIYITFAWDIWWYGGSLGQRAMVQAYPVLAFPLAAFVDSALKTKIWKYIFGFIALLFIYLNLWWTHQAHWGGLFMVEQMNRAYFWDVLGRFKEPGGESLKLLDTNEPGFYGVRKNVRELLYEDFEKDTSTAICEVPVIEGQKSGCLDANRQNLPMYSVPLATGDAGWVRASGVFRCRNKEWTVWLGAQFQLFFYNGDEILKTEQIRVYRFLNDGETKSLFFDIKTPKATFDRVGVSVWNGGGVLPLAVDQLKIEAFDEQ